MISATASRAYSSVSLVALREMKASTACVSASMPVAAVIAGGTPVIRLPSSAAMRGTRRKSMMANLRSFSGSETTAAMVTSEPVPAVVGTAYSGAGLRSSRNRPAIQRTPCGLRARAAMTLAASMEEPPPTAMIASQPCPL